MYVTKEIEISIFDEKKRLDIYLSKLYPHISRSEWQKRIEAGNVLVNQKKSKPSYILKTNDIITFSYIRKEEKKVNTNYKIVYEDNDLLIIDKPSNLPVHPSGSYKENTLFSLLKSIYDYCHPVHRLDRETSGLILFGKNPEIIYKMSKLFKENKIHKIYHTIVMGNFEKELLVEGYIGKHLSSKIQKRQQFILLEKIKDILKIYNNDFQQNCDFFKIFYHDKEYIYRYAKTKFIPQNKNNILIDDQWITISLIKVILYTGRTHQIRATLCDLGYPVVGDKIYGTNENYFLNFLDDKLTYLEKKQLILDRCALHCSELIFIHPKKNIPLHIKIDLPEEFYKLLK